MFYAYTSAIAEEGSSQTFEGLSNLYVCIWFLFYSINDAAWRLSNDVKTVRLPCSDLHEKKKINKWSTVIKSSFCSAIYVCYDIFS
jgi:hypothetical protein